MRCGSGNGRNLPRHRVRQTSTGICSDAGGGIAPDTKRSTLDSRMPSVRQPALSAKSSQQSSESRGKTFSLMATTCTVPKLPTR